MTFPELFMDGKADPTNTVRRRDVTVADGAKHLIKFAAKVHGTDDYIYPFAQHERFGGYIHDFIERHRTLNQANYCMSKNEDLKSVTVEELSALARNSLAHSSLVQRIYKYTSNVTGSDPFWFQRRRELVAQSDQEGLEGTIFWTFSAADNHWRNLMKLLDVPEDAPN